MTSPPHSLTHSHSLLETTGTKTPRYLLSSALALDRSLHWSSVVLGSGTREKEAAKQRNNANAVKPERDICAVKVTRTPNQRNLHKPLRFRFFFGVSHVRPLLDHTLTILKHRERESEWREMSYYYNGVGGGGGGVGGAGAGYTGTQGGWSVAGPNSSAPGAYGSYATSQQQQPQQQPLPSHTSYAAPLVSPTPSFTLMHQPIDSPSPFTPLPSMPSFPMPMGATQHYPPPLQSSVYDMNSMSVLPMPMPQPQPQHTTQPAYPSFDAFAPFQPPAQSQYQSLPATSYHVPAPTTSQYQTPATSQYQTPAASQYQMPASSYQTPASSQYQTPATSQYQMPASTYQTPAASTYQTPAASQYQTPASSQMPASTYQTPASTYQTPATTYQTPASSQYQTPATTSQMPASTYQTPATSQYQAPASTYQAPASIHQTPASTSQTQMPTTSQHQAPVSHQSSHSSVDQSLQALRDSLASKPSPPVTSSTPPSRDSTPTITPYRITNPKDHEGWLTHLLDDNQWRPLYTIIDTQDPTTSVMLMFPDNPVRPPNHSAPLINTNEPTLCICSHQAAIWHQYHLCIYRMRSCLTLRAPLSHRYVMYSLIESSIDD